jgi:DNA ligase-1
VLRWLTRPTEWDSSVDPTGWWVSDITDGVRAYWNGQKLLLSNGKEVSAPLEFLNHLPKVPLDGVLRFV